MIVGGVSALLDVKVSGLQGRISASGGHCRANCFLLLFPEKAYTPERWHASGMPRVPSDFVIPYGSIVLQSGVRP
jgi:hypothetical protein